jgi:phosphoglycolate phosphatase
MSVVSAILFDKDGTLIDFSASWLPAIHQAAHQFAKGNSSDIAKLLAVSGFDQATGKVLSGSLLAAASNQEIAECWANTLNITLNEQLVAQMQATFAYHNANSSVPVTDLKVLFKELKSLGIKIGVATSDSQQGAEATLGAAGVLELMDFVSGFDSGYGVKPQAGMVDAFCQQHQLDKECLMVVGDNTHDLHMARNAKAKYAVGVLTGTSNKQQLAQADYVLDSIADIPALLKTLN